MNRWACFFLILLRLAIGWHFAVEGWQKVESHRIGETITSRPFSSGAYFREAPGPAGDWVRAVVGDPDAEALALLTVAPAPEGKDPASVAPHERMPPALRRQWAALVEKYATHYGLDPERREEAQAALRQAEDGVVLWLTGEGEDPGLEVTRTYPSGEVKRTLPAAELLAEYRKALQELKQASGRKLWLFGRDVEKANLRQRKADVASRRALLLAELDSHTRALLRSLNLVAARPVLAPLERLDNDLVTAGDLLKAAPKDDKLAAALKATAAALTATADAAKDLHPATPESIGAQAVAPLDGVALAAALQARAAALESAAGQLRQAAAGSPEAGALADSVEKDAKELAASVALLPSAKALSLQTQADQTLAWVDWLTRWGLLVIGLCLVVGLLTRLNAWMAAAFLLMTYLLVPPWPWLPAVGPSEGNYLFVNKNVIEFLALCVLGTTATGRWFGVDAVIGWLFSGERRGGEQKS